VKGREERKKKNQENKDTRVNTNVEYNIVFHFYATTNMMKFNGDLKDEVNDCLLSIVRQGDVQAMQRHFSTTKSTELDLNRIHDQPNEQKCTLLMIACLNQYEDMVRILLNYSKFNLEVLNDIQLIEKDQNLWMFQNVTVLWAAAALNNFKIVKLLIEHGAEINHTTKTNSTALRCACRNGNIDMVRYLVEKGADVRITKIHNETNLIASLFNEDIKMTSFLVDDLGYDVNECTDDERSPLYIAAERGSLEQVQFLLNRGARNFRAKHDQMSPIILAAEKRQTNIVAAISLHCSVLEQIEAEEVLGSAFACGEHGICDLEKSFNYFYQALELRLKHNLPKVLRLSTEEVFNNRQECQTIHQLNEFRSDYDNIYIEALLVRERLLGPTNKKYRCSLRYRGAALADNAQHYRGIMLWLYELELRRQHSISMDIDDLRQWTSIFSSMICISPSIPIVAWQTIMTVIAEELERKTADFDYNLHTLLYLITIASQVRKYSTKILSFVD
jgi:Fem-1 family protein b